MLFKGSQKFRDDVERRCWILNLELRFLEVRSIEVWVVPTQKVPTPRTSEKEFFYARQPPAKRLKVWGRLGLLKESNKRLIRSAQYRGKGVKDSAQTATGKTPSPKSQGQTNYGEPSKLRETVMRRSDVLDDLVELNKLFLNLANKYI